jgi:hypothetical protein
MGTRSRIGVMHGDNVKSVYCHWDGYLEHNGAILQEHYDSVKANQLVAMGDLSSLGTQIGEKHPFSPHFDEGSKVAYEAAKDAGYCTFYGRDRGETGTEWKTHTNFVDFFAEVEGSWCEWYYVMRDGVWYVGNCHKTDEQFYQKLVPLTEALATIKEAA